MDAVDTRPFGQRVCVTDGDHDMKLHQLALAVALTAAVGAAQAQAIIQNSEVQLGVGAFGALNVAGGTPSEGDGTTTVGLRSLRTNSDSTSPGCECEGWGVGIRSTGAFGQSNNSVGGVQNLSLVSFSSTASTAVSVVDVLDAAGGAILRVTHDYHPLAGTPYLYEVRVSITNLTGATLAAGDLVYRRVMDWDIPTPGVESVTIQGVPAALGIANGSNIARTDNNGFNPGNPFVFDSYGCENVNFTNLRGGDPCPGSASGGTSASSDQGALFDFEFAALAAGGTQVFNTYYGVAPDKATADLARALVDGDGTDVDVGLYSYGSCFDGTVGGPTSVCNPTTGTPDTFIFGFNVVGGVITDPVPAPATLALVGLGLLGLGAASRRRSVQR
jgi:PEP-CTERM motif